MSGVASKNPYDLLGNDLEDDTPPAPPLQPVDKPLPRTGKRNANGEAPVRGAGAGQARGGRGGRQEIPTGSELAAREGEAAVRNNRERPVDDQRGSRRGARTGRGDPRDKRGGRGNRDDRHSKTGYGPNDHPKQAAHGWGDETAQGELQDEKAGEAIAAADEAVADGEGAAITGEVVAAPEVEAEPEDKSKSYADYLAEQAEKRAALGTTLAIRQPNEGAKKLPEGTAITKEENEEYFAGAGARARRERERKEKNVVKLDHDIQAREREAPRGGRGGRGGRGRGDGAFRGDGRGRGEGRGRGAGRGRGEGRGEFRGTRGARGGPSPNLSDTSAFPSLGA